MQVSLEAEEASAFRHWNQRIPFTAQLLMQVSPEAANERNFERRLTKRGNKSSSKSNKFQWVNEQIPVEEQHTKHTEAIPLWPSLPPQEDKTSPHKRTRGVLQEVRKEKKSARAFKRGCAF